MKGGRNATARSGLLVYGLPILAIIVLAVLLTMTLMRLAGIQREMRHNVDANMVWVIYQAHAESLMLREALGHWLREPASLADAAFRYNMLLSRTTLLIDGPQLRSLQSLGVDEDMLAHAAAIRDFGPVLASVPASAASIEALRTRLSDLNSLLSSTAGKAMVAQWEDAGARLDRYRDAVLTLIFLMVGIWISSALLSVQLLLALKKTRENEQARQREAVLEKQLEHERRISDLNRSFGAMISHQFRTPLAIIDAGMQRLIRAGDRLDPSELAARAEKVRRATQRLTRLIESILEADRFLDQVDIQLQPCCLAELVERAIAEQRALTPDRRIRFEPPVSGSARVRSDAVLATQILSNLLSNAVKYSAADTAVEVRLHREGEGWCCEIRDRGRGIAPEDMPHIFKRYFRARTASDVVGTGLGLHIVSELARLLGGEVRAASEAGSGSTFVLRLPAALPQ